MADLSHLDSEMIVGLVGLDMNGNVTYPLAVDEYGNLKISGDVTVSNLPSFRQFIRRVINPATVIQSTYDLSVKTAVKEVHVGGKAACEGFIGRYNASAISNIGLFNSISEVAAWTNTGVGDSAIGSWTYATDQFFEGTGSAKYTFIKSDANNYPEISYTFTTPIDMSAWRYIQGRVRVTVAAGGAQSRTVQIILKSGTAQRIYSITGTTTTAPFNTEQWLEINREIESPSSIAGSGEFDINNVNSISLRLTDGGNKTGSIWWDQIRLLSSIEILDKIYSANGSTNQIRFDPVLVFEATEDIILGIKNNGTTAAEIQIEASGVEL